MLILAHRAPDEADAPARLGGDVDRLLHPVDVGGERRDQHAPVALRDQVAEDLADGALRLGDAGALRVRRVAEEEIHAAAPDLGEPAHVGLEPIDGRVVELPVAGVDDATGCRLDARRAVRIECATRTSST
jgi:hypothetical protein